MYRSMIKMYYRGVHCAIITYDISSRLSFESVQNWFEDVREKQVSRMQRNSASINGECVYFIVGNKSDLSSKRVVSIEEGKALADGYRDQYKIDIAHLEVSAKSGDNVKKLFDFVAEKLTEKYKDVIFRNSQMKPTQERLSYDLVEQQNQRNSAEQLEGGDTVSITGKSARSASQK